jgi:hypothetical protein
LETKESRAIASFRSVMFDCVSANLTKGDRRYISHFTDKTLLQNGFFSVLMNQAEI